MTDNSENEAGVGLTETLRRLAQIVTTYGLSELTVEEDGTTVTVRAGEAAPPPPMTLSIPAHPYMLPLAQTPAYSQTAVTVPTAPAHSASRVALESPMVGVFYRSPSPEDPSFVNVGDIIRIGQAVGLIEAMKVYSEVPSEVAGRIVEMPVESGKLVQQGQALLYVETL